MLSRKAKLFVISSLFLMSRSITAQSDNTPVYTYLWQARTDDVGGSDDDDNKILKGLLGLTKTTTYTIQSGDSLDFVIRKQFFVSGGQYPRAFQLYLQRILQLNTGVSLQTVLHAGDSLVLPGGPQFSATTLSKRAAPANEISDSYFRLLQSSAFNTVNSTEERIAPIAVRTLKAFVAPAPTAAIANQKRTYDLISSRKLLGAIDLSLHPNAELAQGQVLDLYPANTSDVSLNAIRNADGQHLYPGLMPMSVSPPYTCTACQSCNELLGIPPGLDLSRARVLIEDAGVDLATMSSHGFGNMIIPQTVTASYPTVPPALDVTNDHHGMYVYSQIVKPLAMNDTAQKGILSPEQVFAARVARTIGLNGDQYIAMSDVLAGWTAFEAKLSDTSDPTNKQAAQTWIVNMSLFGEAIDNKDMTPAPPKSNHLLFVVAAGNDKSNTEASLYAFSRFSGPGNALLSVGALGVDDQRASYSNYHPQSVSVVARGDCVCGSPGQLNGTSQSTPLVTLAAAALTSSFPWLNPNEVMWRLVSTADRQPPVNIKESLGGKLNLANALSGHIILQEDLNGSLKVHQVKSVILPGSLISEARGQEILRISRQQTLGMAPCLAVMRMFAGVDLSCPVLLSANSVSYVGIDGVLGTVSLDHVVDIILPLPRWRNTSTAFPTIQVAPESKRLRQHSVLVPRPASTERRWWLELR